MFVSDRALTLYIVLKGTSLVRLKKGEADFLQPKNHEADIPFL